MQMMSMEQNNHIMIRTFIGIHLPDKVKSFLGDQMNALQKRVIPGVKWVPPENLHITIKYLGLLPEELLPAINTAVSDIANGSFPMRLRVCGFGAFPKLSRAQVLWVGIAEECRLVLEEMFWRIDAACCTITKQQCEQRVFHPHITLGRIRRRVRTPHEIVEYFTVQNSSIHEDFIADGLTVFRSVLTDTGSVYSILHQTEAP